MNKIILEDCRNLYLEKNINWEILNGTCLLVTGAYGMLASYMVWMLIYLNEYEGKNISIYAVCRNKEKASIKFGDYCSKDYFHLVNTDIIRPLEIEASIDYIIHAASFASSQYYDINPVGVITPNVLGTYNTLELAREKNVKGYLFLSSGEIYGDIEKEYVFEDDNGLLNCMSIRSCYGESKRQGENLCAAYAHQYGIRTVTVRPSHIYGSTMDLNNDHRVFAEFVSNIINNQNIVIKSDGLATRCFCYIYDAIFAFFKVLLDGESGNAYNVANMDCSVTIRALAETLVKLFPDKELKIQYEKRTDSYLESDFKKHAILSTAKLEKLGWNPKYSIELGFKRTVLGLSEIY